MKDIKNKNNFTKITENKTTHGLIRKRKTESIGYSRFQYARKPNKPATTVEIPDYEGKKKIILSTKKGDKK